MPATTSQVSSRAPLPAQPLGNKTDAERGQHPADGEDGHGQGPQRREGPRRDGLSVAVHPCGVVVLLDDLSARQHQVTRSRLSCAKACVQHKYLGPYFGFACQLVFA